VLQCDAVYCRVLQCVIVTLKGAPPTTLPTMLAEILE